MLLTLLEREEFFSLHSGIFYRLIYRWFIAQSQDTVGN